VIQLQVNPQTGEILAYGHFSAPPEGVDIVEVDESEREKFSQAGKKVWNGSTIIVEPPEPISKDEAAWQKGREVYASATHKAQTIDPRTQGDRSQANIDEMFAFYDAFILWMVDRVQRSSIPLTELDYKWLGLYNDFFAKRNEVQAKHEDPKVSVEGIQAIDPTV
jgi:hypothetical protein